MQHKSRAHDREKVLPVSRATSDSTGAIQASPVTRGDFLNILLELHAHSQRAVVTSWSWRNVNQLCGLYHNDPVPFTLADNTRLACT
jgi:hypothetical protein